MKHISKDINNLYCLFNEFCAKAEIFIERQKNFEKEIKKIQGKTRKNER